MRAFGAATATKAAAMLYRKKPARSAYVSGAKRSHGGAVATRVRPVTASPKRTSAIACVPEETSDTELHAGAEPAETAAVIFTTHMRDYVGGPSQCPLGSTLEVVALTPERGVSGRLTGKSAYTLCIFYQQTLMKLVLTRSIRLE